MQHNAVLVYVRTFSRSKVRLECTSSNLIMRTFDTDVERKHGTYDAILTSLTGACPISAFKPRQIDVIRTTFTFVHYKNSGVKLTPDRIQYRYNLEWCQSNTIVVLS